MSPIIDVSNKTIAKTGRHKSHFYKKSREENEIWSKFSGLTLRQIQEKTGINMTRVFRLKTFGGMMLIERDLFLSALEKIER